MHTFPCNCGHTITIDPPSEHAGYVVRDSDVDASIDARRAEVRGFLAALTTGQRDAWMRYFYGTETKSRLTMKTDADVIEDILSKQDAYTRFCYRCDACGRGGVTRSVSRVFPIANRVDRGVNSTRELENPGSERQSPAPQFRSTEFYPARRESLLTWRFGTGAGWIEFFTLAH